MGITQEVTEHIRRNDTLDIFQYIEWKCPFSVISKSFVACVAVSPSHTHTAWKYDENLNGKGNN